MGKSKIQPSSDEYVLDQLSISEEKLLKLLEELDQSGKDLKDIQKQMDEEEVRPGLVNCLLLLFFGVFFV